MYATRSGEGSLVRHMSRRDSVKNTAPAERRRGRAPQAPAPSGTTRVPGARSRAPGPSACGQSSSVAGLRRITMTTTTIASTTTTAMTATITPLLLPLSTVASATLGWMLVKLA